MERKFIIVVARKPLLIEYVPGKWVGFSRLQARDDGEAGKREKLYNFHAVNILGNLLI